MIAELLADLVRRPSVNPLGRTDVPDSVAHEHRVTDYLEQRLARQGIPCLRQPVHPGRDNLLAWVESPGAARTILLEVHQDTVPVEGMTIDPFGAEVRGGKLYGRGACDVKAGMAAMLAALERLHRERPAGAANVVLACTVDEELALTGVRRLVRGPWPLGGPPDFAVVAEPTCLKVVTAHKGVTGWELVTDGRAAHASRPGDGVNAVYRMARLLVAAEAYAGRLSAARAHPTLGPATLSVGRVVGGVSVNTVPDRCAASVDRRLLPGEDPSAAADEFAAALRAAGGAGDFRLEATGRHCPPLRPGPGRPRPGRPGRRTRPGRRPPPDRRRRLRHRRLDAGRGGRADGRLRPRRHRPGPHQRRVGVARRGRDRGRGAVRTRRGPPLKDTGHKIRPTRRRNSVFRNRGSLIAVPRPPG